MLRLVHHKAKTPKTRETAPEYQQIETFDCSSLEKAKEIIFDHMIRGKYCAFSYGNWNNYIVEWSDGYISHYIVEQA